MARNEEKAQSMLNRWMQMKLEETLPPKKKRPFLVSECENLQEAEKWRMQIIKEIGAKVYKIQNASLPEPIIRDLNDEINKLIREKAHWQRRIRELGGAFYPSKSKDDDDNAIIAPGGYRYFGAAQNLPGVKELLAPPVPKNNKRTRYDMYRGIDADYYGYRDEDDGLLLQVEAPAEQAAREKSILQWNQRQKQKFGEDFDPESTIPQKRPDLEDNLVSLVQIPTREDMEQLLLEKRKRVCFPLQL
eukprot:TRINITY_DN8678_c0_g1_i4.p1 TRINITY_DN8678_c0_g1~~TRINITY_DN8678_c0_g1_i4.p1  ORF type:complete len:246 (+),score=49.59 TRINITY_DN8678_c0_g1_i4:86-823(+)